MLLLFCSGWCDDAVLFFISNVVDFVGDWTFIVAWPTSLDLGPIDPKCCCRVNCRWKEEFLVVNLTDNCVSQRVRGIVSIDRPLFFTARTEADTKDEKSQAYQQVHQEWPVMAIFGWYVAAGAPIAIILVYFVTIVGEVAKRCTAIVILHPLSLNDCLVFGNVDELVLEVTATLITIRHY